MDPAISMMPTVALHTAAPFKDLFPIHEGTLNDVVESMKEKGFDWSTPIILWAGHKVTVVDGHTRLAAAQKLHINQVPVILHEFKDENDALQYAIVSQRARRVLTDAELLACISALDKRNPVGRPEKTASREVISGPSAKKTAKMLKISKAKVERIRTVNDHGSDKTKAAVASGKMSINKAYNQTMNERKSREEQREKIPEEKLAEVRADRIAAMVKTITEKVKRQFETEVQEFPELRYSSEERNRLGESLCNAISKLVVEMIPCETETENNEE